MEQFIPEFFIGPEAVGDEFLSHFSTDDNCFTILHDGYLRIEAISVLLEISNGSVHILDARKAAPSALESEAVPSVLVCACVDDGLCLPFIDIAKEKGHDIMPLYYGRPHGSDLIVLHDGSLGINAISILFEMSSGSFHILDVRKASPSLLDKPSTCSALVYACIQDDIGLPFIDLAYTRGLRVVPVCFAHPRNYLWRNRLAKDILLQELARQRDEGYLKADHGIRDFINLIQAFERTKHLSGCIVELGCYRGSSAGALLSYVASQAKSETGFMCDLFYLDVFDGFNYPESLSSSDSVWHGSHGTEGLMPIRQRLQAYASDAAGMNVHVLKCNVISDPIPQEILEHKIRLLNVDVDLYEAVASALQRYAEHVVVGGIVFCEDAGHTPLLIGAFKAVEEFMSSELGNLFCRFDLPSGQTMLVRIANDA